MVLSWNNPERRRVTMKKKLTIEELQVELDKIEPNRQHGRVGIILPDSDAEYRRLYNNLASRLSRARKKQAEASVIIPKLTRKTKTLFTDKDIRQYKNCFIYESIMPERTYIKRMTGFTDYQIDELSKLTNLKPAKY